MSDAFTEEELDESTRRRWMRRPRTNLALQAAVRVGTSATDWLGSHLGETGPAIFFSAEEPRDEIHLRLDYIRQHYQLEWVDLVDVIPISTIEHDIDPTMAGLVKRTGNVEPTHTYQWFREIVLDFKVKLFCIEAAADVFSVDEINRGQAKACVRLLQRLAIEADAACLLLFHPSLSGITSGRGTSGSTQWSNTMRSRLYFQPLKDGDSEGLKVLEVLKANRGPTGEKVILEWRNGLFLPLKTVTTVERAAREQEVDTAFLTALRRLNGQNQTVSPGKTSKHSAANMMQDSVETKGISNKELAAAQQRLLDAGKIRIEAYGSPSRGTSRLVVT
jgi:RecA-family ATPase